MSEETTLVVQLPKALEKQLRAHYDEMIATAVERALEDKELYKPMVRMAALARWLDVSTTTLQKWTREGMPTLIIKARDFIRTQLREFQYLDDNGQFQILPEYPEFAWFEGVVNAVTHRDYSVYGDHIRVLMFDDRLEIHSPGKLPNIVTVDNIKHERFSRNPRIARTLTEFGWVREMNEGVKRIYSEMESAFLHEPKYYEPGNKVVLTLENNIVSRHLRTRDSLEKQFSDFGDLNADEQLLVHYMYNSGEKMTTAKAIELTGRSRSFVVKMLHHLRDLEIITWFGSSKNDRNQYYLLVDK
ncbi:Uncharacterised protein [Streptococcus dysgalactiae subsp. equisimilis]|nr:putative transcriptional regulator [Streptococcus dysgalactiae subsp. equisimilis 167]SLM21948.1 Uncharacterised protein [Streptococcus dysgalactiae subsp. equisimilis]SQE85135.1 putative transcriptional regulator [Streptococcus dysgalactiae subsp. equisimilis]